MVAKGLKDYAKENGLKVSEGVAYGVVGGYHFLTQEEASLEIFTQLGEIIGIDAAVPLSYGRLGGKALVCARFGRAEDEKSHRGYDADDKKHRDEKYGR